MMRVNACQGGCERANAKHMGFRIGMWGLNLKGFEGLLGSCLLEAACTSETCAKRDKAHPDADSPGPTTWAQQCLR